MIKNIHNSFSKTLHEHINDPQVYGKFLISDDQNNQYSSFHVSITLLNKYMLKADAYFFSTLTTMLADMNENTIESLDIPTFPLNDQYTEEDTLIFQNYHPYFFEFRAQSNDSELRDFIQNHTGEWIPMLLTSKADISSENFVVKGTLSFGASPLIHQGRSLVFNKTIPYDPLITYIDKAYSPYRLAFITSHCINRASTLDYFKSLLPTTITRVDSTVYNVGQANNIKLQLQNDSESCTLLYDVGAPFINSELSKPDIHKNIGDFATAKFNAIVLSHWDTDHIIGVEYYDETLLYSRDMVWIAPNPCVLTSGELGHSAFILACYTAFKSNLFLAEQHGKCLNIGNDAFEIWQGEGTPTKEATHNNTIGLIIELKKYKIAEVHDTIVLNHSKREPVMALLTGDCPFATIPAALKTGKKYDILISPHHGSGRTIPDIIGSGKSTAIICSGKSGTKYKYPSAKHVKKLIKNGFSNILITELVSNIHFTLKR